MTDSKETLMQKWAVKTVQDPTVGNLQTPVNSGWFTRMVINNLPVYREGLSPNFRGLETGAIFGYLLFGPFSMTGPLRNTDFALTAGLLGGVGAIQILTALFILYNAPGKAPNVQPPDATVINPPADLFTRTGWSEFTNGFWLGGTGGVVFAWLLIGTLHLDTVLPLIKEYHLLGA